MAFQCVRPELGVLEMLDRCVSLCYYDDYSYNDYSNTSYIASNQRELILL